MPREEETRVVNLADIHKRKIRVRLIICTHQNIEVHVNVRPICSKFISKGIGFVYATSHHQSKNCLGSSGESMTEKGQLKVQLLGRAASWQDTAISKLSKDPQRPSKTDRNGFDPRSTFSRTDAPPFSSHTGLFTVSVDENEQKSRDQCNTKGVKRNHPR